MKERLTPHHALAALARREDNLPFVELLTHGSLSVEMYRPIGQDTQTPHTRDEVYVVVSGVGEFVNDGQRKPFEPGELLFVPAGVEHRFENFSDDFATWVIFYGPEGGEHTRVPLPPGEGLG
ncbi:cupin domain-containing protein [Pseudoxanthomonas sacheonensis]|uniref:Mannose-6-phosphate isomerase-like protein (Cupin superfamily) n=1 Tax=Pseudoxanthomonas sacheonensis TaxID=443615 RepID=A0ABU1RSX3_9GAMM|nr:cupin domain-containing protein [Pseudoxanthomonas sacheonensis]MDR6841882.1 mannose-6-phosphate isomerase-like protein (cupin superfamily) [Pseudoxanthomonas sacheonensis]